MHHFVGLRALSYVFSLAHSKNTIGETFTFLNLMYNLFKITFMYILQMRAKKVQRYIAFKTKSVQSCNIFFPLGGGLMLYQFLEGQKEVVEETRVHGFVSMSAS